MFGNDTPLPRSLAKPVYNPPPAPVTSTGSSTWIWIIGGAAVLGVGGYLLLRKKKYKSNTKRKAGNRYFVFMYERGMKSPKEYYGPFSKKKQAEAAKKSESTRYGIIPDERWTVRSLSDAQFERIWGAPPQG